VAERASGAGHLPKRGGPEAGGPPPELPRQRRGTTPQMHGRYPDYDVLAECEHWDEPTRAVVLARLRPPPLRFFDEGEAETLGAFCDVALAQDREPRVPVLQMIDAKLFEHRLEGYRHHDMPPDSQAWRQVARMLDAAAQGLGADGFAPASPGIRRELVERFSKGELEWEGMPVAKAWGVVMRDMLGAFYSHPWAWNEIGFGGPAYPRGFARLGPGQREHWEAPPRFELDPVADVAERGLE
jgi:hypothetical protein